MFLKKSQSFSCPQKIEKKTTLKSCSEKLKYTFFPSASTAQMGQTEEFMFQNMAYRLDQLYIELGIFL